MSRTARWSAVKANMRFPTSLPRARLAQCPTFAPAAIGRTIARGLPQASRVRNAPGFIGAGVAQSRPGTPRRTRAKPRAPCNAATPRQRTVLAAERELIGAS